MRLSSTTLDATALASSSPAGLGQVSQPRFTLIFRWTLGSELVELEEGRAITVGRASGCDVRIQDRSLSRQHARFTRERDRLIVEDLGSRNAVSLGGRKLQRSALESGDVLRLGHVTVHVFIFRDAASSAPARAQPLELWNDLRMAELRRTVEKLAPTPLPVLIHGETGSGKELVARELHRCSQRSGSVLRSINCATIPATLIESTLFGHERGAFTGAERAQPGLFEQANGGTVFLDEIGELSASAQAALLRVLENGRFTRVGSTRELAVDVRVVAATHRDLRAMVEQNAFRLDLLHRLDAVTIEVPALRERADAIAPLARHFLALAAEAWAKAPKALDEAALAMLCAYAWPGNVRELRNVMDRAMALSEGETIGVADLPERLRCAAAAEGRAEAGASSIESLHAQHAREERELLARTLEQSSDRRAAAARLNISLRTLERRMQQHGLSKARS